MSNGRVAGKVALVTGAARGQGAAEARLLVAEGAKVVLGDVLDDDGGAVAAELGDAAIYRHLDVTSEADWTSAVETAVGRFGGLNILVSNAGISPRPRSIVDTRPDQYRKVVEINQALELTPEIVNQDPYGKGWLAVIEVGNWEGDRAKLLDPQAYFTLMREQAEQELKQQ